MKNLFIYHPGTGTVISLADPVYLIDGNSTDVETTFMLNMGDKDIPVEQHKGYRIDNYNMTNLFFGD